MTEDLPDRIARLRDGGGVADVLDIHNTARSRRSINALKGRLGARCRVRRHAVTKRTLYRIFLVILAYFAFTQRRRRKASDRSDWLTIHALQARLVTAYLKSQGPRLAATDAFEISRIGPEEERTRAGPAEGMLRAPAFTPLMRAGLAPERYVAVFPGASGFLKAWPKEHFRACIEAILARTDLDVAILGGDAERALGAYLAFPERARVKNLVGDTDLAGTLSAVAHAAYVITGDSFATHAADLYGVPSTVIFGATSPKFGFVPLNPRATVRYLDLACSPCTRHGKGHCRFSNLACLRGIGALDVADDVRAACGARVTAGEEGHA